MDSPLFCDHCRSLYPAEGLNHFELLGVPPTFDLDPATLRQRYLHLSRNVHPDRRCDEESPVSLQLSARLNEAHRVLADPVLRAEYLLEVVGGHSASADKAVPQEVLATTLALREEIADAKLSQDTAGLEACGGRVRRLCENTQARIAELARQLPGDDELRQQLRATLNAMKYYLKLLAEL